MLKTQIKQTKAGNLKKKKRKTKETQWTVSSQTHTQTKTRTILILKQAKHQAKQKDYVF